MARRNISLIPTPVYDENHVNVMPIPPKKKGDNKPSLENRRIEELVVKPKRKRKPKSK